MQNTQEDEISEFLPSSHPDPRHTNTRFFLLFLSCFICIGSYFIYDNPAALEVPLRSTLSLDIVSFNLLYSVYSFPNIIFPVLGGLLVDTLGVRSVLFVCSVLIVIGQTLFVVGVHQRSFLLVLLGRGIFGCGGENLDLAQSVIVYRWFSGKELSMAFGMNSMTSLMGSVLNDNIEPVVVEYFGITNGLILGLFVCLLSLGCTILVIFLDKCRDKSLKAPESESFDLKNISKFNPMFFFLLIYTICMDCSIYCFSYIASGFLQERFGYSSVEAGSLMSVSFLVSSLLSPFFGILADKHGKRALMLIVADLLVFFFHIFFMVCDDQTTTIHIASAFTALGIGFAIYMTVFWTTLAYVVKKEIVGTAYGVCYAVCNLALAVCPVVVGVIERETVRDWGYFWVNGFLGLLAFLGALAAYAVYDLDLKSGGLLEKVDSLNINLKSS